MDDKTSTFKLLLYVLLGASGLIAFLLSRAKLRNGFLLFILLLGLGYRTYHATQTLRIIPAELVLWALPLLLLGQQTRERSAPAGSSTFPVWIYLMLPFWVLAWCWDAAPECTWDVRLSEFRNFAMLIPLFLAAPVVLREKGGWRSAVLCFEVLGVWLAGMGIFEHFLPGIARSIPGLIADPNAIVAGEFQRARFSFYGSPIAVFICAQALPFAFAAWRWWPSPAARVALIVGVVIQLAAIYISGYRSIWLLLAAQFAVFAIVRKQFTLGVLVLCLACAAYPLLPKATRERIESINKILEQKPDEIDTSGQNRWERARGALDMALRKPLGSGWAASGWVHSDFIQVAANQGLIPGAIFVGAYLATLWRLIGRGRAKNLSPELEALHLPLVLAFTAVGGILLYEGVEFLPQTVLPVWLVWALVETWLGQTSSSAGAKTQRGGQSRPIARPSRSIQKSKILRGKPTSASREKRILVTYFRNNSVSGRLAR